MPLIAALVALFAAPVGAGDSIADPCAGSGTSIVVDTATSRLWLCEQGRLGKVYPVALGRAGVGKTTEGDKKTPLGTFTLGEPRSSRRFGLFIPIGYPTLEQRKRGATGADVGIHGPDRRFTWAGRANTWFNWTAGCVALSTDVAMAEVAAWVRKERPALVYLR